MKYVVIFGYKGNMGRRYVAILNSLGVPWRGIDADTHPLDEMEILRGEVRSFLIATPSALHATNVMTALQLGYPVLVEKPLAFTLETVETCCREAEKRDVPLQMVNQYRHMGLMPQDHGPSEYNYWNHGRDGLAFDCISILGLARGETSLGERSPVWRCTINGRRLDISRMDAAYIAMISTWLERPDMATDYIRNAHVKVLEYMKCSDRESSLAYRPAQPQPGSPEKGLC